MEMVIFEDSSYNEVDVLQFSFIEKTGTIMAIGLVNDIIQYFNKERSPVYSCTFDAEQAFNGIPT